MPQIAPEIAKKVLVVAWFICVGAVLVYSLLRAVHFCRCRGADQPSEPVLYSGPAGVEQALRGGGSWQWLVWVRATLTIYASHVEMLAPQGVLGSRMDIVLPSETATMRLARHGPFGLPLLRREYIRLVGCEKGGRRQEFMLAPKGGSDSAWQALLRSGVEPLPSTGARDEYYGASRRLRAAQAIWTGVWAVGLVAPTALGRPQLQGGAALLAIMLLFVVWSVGVQVLGWLEERAPNRGRTPASRAPFEPTPELGALHLTVVLVFVVGLAYFAAFQSG